MNMDEEIVPNPPKLPVDFLTKRRKQKKVDDQIILLPFSGEYIDELMDWLTKEDCQPLLKEFLYGCKVYKMS